MTTATDEIVKGAQWVRIGKIRRVPGSIDQRRAWALAGGLLCVVIEPDAKNLVLYYTVNPDGSSDRITYGASEEAFRRTWEPLG